MNASTARSPEVGSQVRPSITSSILAQSLVYVKGARFVGVDPENVLHVCTPSGSSSASVQRTPTSNASTRASTGASGSGRKHQCGIPKKRTGQQFGAPNFTSADQNFFTYESKRHPGKPPYALHLQLGRSIFRGNVYFETQREVRQQVVVLLRRLSQNPARSEQGRRHQPKRACGVRREWHHCGARPRLTARNDGSPLPRRPLSGDEALFCARPAMRDSQLEKASTAVLRTAQWTAEQKVDEHSSSIGRTCTSGRLHCAARASANPNSERVESQRSDSTSGRGQHSAEAGWCSSCRLP